MTGNKAQPPESWEPTTVAAMREKTMSARITDQGRSYVAWLNSLGDEEPTRTGAFAAGVEWERKNCETLREAVRAYFTFVDAMHDADVYGPTDAQMAEYGEDSGMMTRMAMGNRLHQARAALEALAQEQES